MGATSDSGLGAPGRRRSMPAGPRTMPRATVAGPAAAAAVGRSLPVIADRRTKRSMLCKQ